MPSACLLFEMLLLASCTSATLDFDPWMEDFFPTLPNSVQGNVSVQCHRESVLLDASLRNGTRWAIQMWHASGRASGGLLEGNVFQYGDFDACLAAKTPLGVGPKYCLVTLTASRRLGGDVVDDDDVWTPFQPSKSTRRRDRVFRGLCIPASCSASEIQASLVGHLAKRRDDVIITPTLTDADCQVTTSRTLGVGALAFCATVACLFILVTCASLYDSFCATGNDRGARGLLVCFSLPRNLKGMCETEEDKRLSLLQGIRVLLMARVISDHGCALRLGGLVTNLTTTEWLFSHPLGVFLTQSELSVDSFFVLSGLTLTYGLLAACRKREVTFLRLLVLRYCRLTPAFGLVVFFYASIFPLLGDGPVWSKYIDLESQACATNWLVSLLYLGNYVDTENICLVQSWFLPCDFHFFVFGTVLIFAIQRNRKLGFTLYTCALLTSVFSLAIFGFDAQGPPVVSLDPDMIIAPRSSRVFRTAYVTSHHRASAYLVGIATGFLIDRAKHVQITSKLVPALGVLVSTLIKVTTLWASAPLFDADATGDVMASVWGGLRRFFWAIGTAIFVTSLVLTRGCCLKRTLSWSMFVPLSKLVYTAFLIHLAVQQSHTSSARGVGHVTAFSLFRAYLGDVFWTLIFSLAVHLAAEAPMRSAFKLMLHAQPHAATRKQQ